MEINAKITILFDRDGLSIEVHDGSSACIFFRAKLNAENTCRALSRQARIEPEMAEVYNLDRIGKQLEIDRIKFPMPTNGYSNRIEVAEKEAMKHVPAGWVMDTYFNSQDSFFYEDGKLWARATIRRWV